MSEVIIIGLDIAKYVFHVHGADSRVRVNSGDRSKPENIRLFETHELTLAKLGRKCAGEAKAISGNKIASILFSQKVVRGANG